MRYISLAVFLSLVLAHCANGDTIALWNFNDAIQETTGGMQEFLVDRGNGFMNCDFLTNNIGNAAGSTLNGEMDDPAGLALHLSGNSNNRNSLTWMVDTTGFSSIDISFATRRTSTGFNNNQFQYSIDDGISWMDFGSPYRPDTVFGRQVFDLSGIQELENNSGAGFRIVFDGATSYSGNNRIDNLAVSGVPSGPPPATTVPEPSTVIMLGLGMSGTMLIQKRFLSDQN